MEFRHWFEQWGSLSFLVRPPSWRIRNQRVSIRLGKGLGTRFADENVFSFEVAMVDAFVEEVGAATDELPEHGQCFGFREVALFFEDGFQVPK